jgi:hypothetical protein
MLTPVVLDQKEGATPLRQSKEDDWSLPKELLPRRAVKRIAAYQEVTAIDQHVCKDDLRAPVVYRSSCSIVDICICMNVHALIRRHISGGQVRFHIT